MGKTWLVETAKPHTPNASIPLSVRPFFVNLFCREINIIATYGSYTNRNSYYAIVFYLKKAVFNLRDKVFVTLI